MLSCTGIGGVGRQIDIGNITTGEEWNMPDTMEQHLRTGMGNTPTTEGQTTKGTMACHLRTRMGHTPTMAE